MHRDEAIYARSDARGGLEVTERWEHGVDFGDEIVAPFSQLHDAESYIAACQAHYRNNGLDQSVLLPGTVVRRRVVTNRSAWEAPSTTPSS